jgi:hypothetical protein
MILYRFKKKFHRFNLVFASAQNDYVPVQDFQKVFILIQDNYVLVQSTLGFQCKTLKKPKH